MDNWQWTMDNGQWAMDNGQWAMTSVGAASAPWFWLQSASVLLCHCEPALAGVAISRYDLKYCCALRWIVPGDCHVAALLAMTCFFEGDCHVAALLAMTCFFEGDCHGCWRTLAMTENCQLSIFLAMPISLRISLNITSYPRSLGCRPSARRSPSATPYCSQ